uniref:YUP8H12.27 protein n=1 Tax=Arabidopsis thaliana TaxID=3702 RepID=O23055_ARATH|nr:Similar to Saccharomyces RAD16 (gb/X78993) [Arabidopsis thaliana]
MELRSRNKAIRPSTEVVDLEEGTGINPDEEPYAISSDDDSIGSEFQGDEEEEEELEEVVANDDLPNPVPVLAIVNLPRASKKRKKPDARKEKVVLLWETWEKEQNSWIDEHMSEDVDLDQHNAVIAETAEPPSDLIMPLLRYQKEFLAWATKQEQSVAGGILADEMGMGKTIQAISLVLARREVDRAQFGEAAGCTLVLCPLVAVSQWLNEIARFTSPGSTKVLVYHGAKRAKNIKEFMNYDFVLTTYSTVESEYRRNIMPSKVQCAYCSKSFYPKKLVIHLRYFCGPSAVKTAKQSKQKRKKTSDSSSQQGKEADAGEDKKLKKSKKKTKQTVEKDQLGSDDKEKSLLHSVKWNRIILDEAHYIKERRSNTARAVFALEATYRWALSGTPLQNRVGELYSLIRFLQIRPYSYYFCKDCDCRILDYFCLIVNNNLCGSVFSGGVCSAHQSCPHCPHNAVRHFCWWNKYVAKPITVYGSFGLGKRAMILLKHKVLKDILLRRTKLGRAADLALPPRIITLRRDTLDVKEFDYYESLYKNSQAEFNTYIEAGTLMNNYAHIFDLLTRLRQVSGIYSFFGSTNQPMHFFDDIDILAVDHPYLVVYSNSSGANANLVDENKSEQECGLCHDPAEDYVVITVSSGNSCFHLTLFKNRQITIVTSCAHVFCKACLIGFSASLGKVTCPTCSKLLTVDWTTKADTEHKASKTTLKGFRASSILNRIKLDDFQTSTKIEALREEIRFMVERDGSAKAIVFSQFTSFLDLINYTLGKCGVSCVQLVGSMTMAARDTAINKFKEDPDCRVFLMSLKAGGVALNLTVASHVSV